MTRAVEWMNGRITDEGIAEAIAQIERPKPFAPIRVTEDFVGRFAFGIGDDNPLWWDSDYAKATDAGAMFAPPTSIYGGGQRRPGERDVGSYTESILPGVMGLWAGDRWTFHRPAWVGETITGSTALFEVKEGRTSFADRTVTHTERSEYIGGDGTLVAELFRTLHRFERGSSRAAGKYLEIPEPAYTAEQIEKIKKQYEAEPGLRQGGIPRYWDDVVVGDPLLTLVKGPLTLAGLISYLQAMGTSSPGNRLMFQYLENNPGGRVIHPETGIEDYIGSAHFTDYYAKQSGLPRGYDVGAMRTAWLIHLLTDWMGDSGFITEFSMKLRRPNLIGDTTWLTGTVTGKRMEGESALVDCEVVATNQRDEVTANARATIRLPLAGR